MEFDKECLVVSVAVPCELSEGYAVNGDIFVNYGPVGKKDFFVACGDEELRILTVQPESKKRMSAAVFLNGRGVKTGDVLIS